MMSYPRAGNSSADAVSIANIVGGTRAAVIARCTKCHIGLGNAAHSRLTCVIFAGSSAEERASRSTHSTHASTKKITIDTSDIDIDIDIQI